MNTELLKLLHLIFLIISNIVSEFHSPIQSISENIGTFFNLFIFTLFKTWLQFNQNEKKLTRSLFIALYHCYIGFHNSEFPCWNLLNLKHLQKELLPAVQRLCKHKNWIFLQDNTPQHSSNLVKDFLTRNTQFAFYQSTWTAPLVTWLQSPRLLFLE